MNESIRFQMADRIQEMMNALKLESDRGGVVLASAWVEDSLTTLILAAFIKEAEKKATDLVKPSGALGDFGAKIELAYQLGFLRTSTYQGLNILRRLRNDFAHLKNTLNFETPEVKGRVIELFSLNENLLEVFAQHLINVQKKQTPLGQPTPQQSGTKYLIDIMGTRRLFDLSVSAMASGLLLASSQVERFVMPE